MPIEALPPTAVRAIGSTQCLTDSSSVVKELVDNAIDAHASAVFVEVSANAIDKILVKDNGHGIAPEDRKLVGQRFCTSKIRDLGDLRTLGGQSMGFRGEALASAVDMSSQVTLTTRVDGEEIAVELIYRPEDQTASERRVSHPTGTAVTIVDFLKNLPVRRQAAIREKSSNIQLSKIKRCLQAYALARPHVRFCFKVLKAKTEKYNWTYAPQPNASSGMARMRDAAIKVYGKKLADTCQLVAWKVDDSKPDDEISLSDAIEASSLGDSPYLFQAFLPTPNARSNFLFVEKPRQFLSVDSRAVSGTRGTFKRIISIFKKCFRSMDSSKSSDTPTDPFLCLNIVCRNGSYDANIEPAKDDVLFDDPDYLLACIERFFDSVYRSAATKRCPSPSLQSLASLDRFDLNLAGEHTRSPSRKPMSTHPDRSDAPEIPVLHSRDSIHETSRSSQEPHDSLAQLKTAAATLTNKYAGRRLMYDFDEEDGGGCEVLDDDDPEFSQDQSHEDTRKDISVSNPWAFAKFNASLRQTGTSPVCKSNPERNTQLPTPKRQMHDIGTSPAASSSTLFDDFKDQGPPTPQRSSSPTLFPFPQQRRAKHPYQAGGDPITGSMNAPNQSNQALDNWTHPSSSVNIALPSNPDPHNPQYRTSHDFVSARTLPAGTPLSEIPDISQKPRGRGRKKQHTTGALNKPFVPPSMDIRDVWFNHTGSQPKPPKQKHSLNQKSQRNEVEALDLREPEDPPPPSQPIHPDLAPTLDYENRKRQATLDYRANERRQALQQQRSLSSQAHQALATPPSSSPHQNRYLKAKAALQQPSFSTTAPSPAGHGQRLLANDPRAILLHEHNHPQDANDAADQTPPKAHSKRTRTALLPLETVADAESVRDLLLRLSVSAEDIERQIEKVSKWDTYIDSGDFTEGFIDVRENGIKSWQIVVEGLVKREYAGHAEVKVDVKGALDAWASVEMEGG